jgi:exoribonuclease R
MPSRPLHLTAPEAPDLRAELADIRHELKIPGHFSADVLADTERSIANAAAPEIDMTDVPFVTIDPPSAMDLDQALHLSRDGAGYLIRYAIADVPTFVAPGGALDTDVHSRGVTYYGPDTRAPLHPIELSEAAASLLPGTDRPALVWEIKIDSSGERRGDPVVRRALVRSRAKLDYEGVQHELDAGTAGEMLELLPVVGQLRQERERARGGVSLNLPDQEIVANQRGFDLVYRSQLPIEGWNAQLSLLTGIAAAAIMRQAGVGIFRSVPDADEPGINRLRRTAKALGVEWPGTWTYADVIASLQPDNPMHLAFRNDAAGLFRGSGYVAFDETASRPIPDNARHAAIAAEYAHVTAPLRRLVDRYGLATCVAASAGADIPDWVLAGLPDVPEAMDQARRRAGQYEGMCVAAVEAALLTGHEGRTFHGVIVEVARDNTHGQVVINEPAVRGRVNGDDLPLGEEVTVRLAEASIEARRVLFTLA